MTPNIRSSIPKFFPNHDEAAILHTLLRTGHGLSHARSCVTYFSLLHCCSENQALLTRMVDFANAAPIDFAKYISRYARWQFLIDQIAEYDLLAFFAPIVQRFAIEASQFRFAWLASHFTIGTAQKNANTEPNDLHFVPIINTGVFITSDSNSKMMVKTIEITEHCDGKLSLICNATSDMVRSLERFYQKDSIAPIAG